jgi:thiazole synthase
MNMDGAALETGTAADPDDGWTVAGRRFRSRLVVGTGKYKSLEETAAAIEASGAEIVTVAVRRVNLSDPGAPMLQDHVDPKRYTYLPNTAGCHTAKDAVRTLRLAREAGGWNLVKLEVLGPPPHLYPDMAATLEAAEALISDGFEVMVYCADDPVAQRRLEDLGCVAIMPLGAPIGSGLGIAGDEMRGRGRPARLSGRPYAAPPWRRSIQPADRADPLTRGSPGHASSGVCSSAEFSSAPSSITYVVTQNHSMTPAMAPRGP